MIRSSFFNSVLGDRKYNALNFAEYFNSFIGNGVFPNPLNNLQVVSNDNMTVTVLEGRAWINGYLLINDDDYILNIDVADGVLKRIDRVVARLDFTTREIRVEVKKGAFASSPVAPTLQRDTDAYELGIADILVNNGVVSIIQGNITDLRSNTELCGKVDSLIAGDINSLVTSLNEHKDKIATQDERGHLSFDDIPNLWQKIDEVTLAVNTLKLDITIPLGYKEIFIICDDLSGSWSTLTTFCITINDKATSNYVFRIGKVTGETVTHTGMTNSNFYLADVLGNSASPKSSAVIHLKNTKNMVFIDALLDNPKSPITFYELVGVINEPSLTKVSISTGSSNTILTGAKFEVWGR